MQHPRRRQIQTQMQQKRMSATNPAAAAIKMVIFRGSGKENSFIDRANEWRMIFISFLLNDSHSMTLSCWATQLLGDPTLLEDSQRYIPASALETLLNFCSKQKQDKMDFRLATDRI